ncbi:NAD+ synthase [candidate division KSB1 bacterium]
MQSNTDKHVDMNIDTEFVEKILTGFIGSCFEKTGAEKAIVGLSGGLDSSVTAALCVKALGSDRVHGVIMPYRTSAGNSRKDAEHLASHLEIKFEVVDITPMTDEYFKTDTDADDNRRGNMMARQRMAVLYDISAREKGLVVGTSNKSELLLGYGTIFGDLACAINPLGDLYKTQLRQLAKSLGIPGRILKKKPSADLIAGQTDETDLGFSYEKVDPLLYLLIDEQFPKENMAEYGYTRKFVDDVEKRIRRNHYKRIPPLIAKVSKRTIGHEFRYAWDWSTV